ncbi:MAG: hypothetical protein HYZ34_08520 [Ignavibacteriae bacterium]|nr:hypothetical protein [Ignavibacteriota bacterium]
MKTLFYILLVILVLVSLPLTAQEKKTESDEQQNSPPQPLNDETSMWMIGEWSGTSESNMGNGDEWQSIKFGLDNQYVIMDYTSTYTSLNEESVNNMAKQMNMPKDAVEGMMKSNPYKGHGLMTLDPKTGEWLGYWFDSWRGFYQGRGKLEGKKITMQWEGPMGKSTRTIEIGDDGEMIQNFKEQDSMGNVMEGKSTMTKKKK